MIRPARTRTVLAALAVTAMSGAPAHAAPAVNGVFDVSDTPGKLVEGSDHNIWVLVGGDTLARFTPAGDKQEFPQAGVANAKGITTGPDGNLWLTAPNKLFRVKPVDPTAAPTPFTINDIITPQAIVKGPDDNLWTASADKVLKITLADPANPTLFTLTSTMSPSARGIARSGDLLWVADFSGAIVSITTAGVQKPYDVGGSPQEVGGGPGGQILYANPGGTTETVGRIVPNGSPLTSDRPNADPFGIAFGQDGAYWVAEFAAGDLARITTDGVVTTLPGLKAAREVTTGPNNTLWVSLETDKQVARVTGVDPPVVTPPVIQPPAPAPALPVPADKTAPVISKLRITPTRLRRGLAPLLPVAKTPAASKPKPAAKVSLTLSEAATVTFTAERLVPGRRQGTRCVAPTRRNRRARPCRRVRPAGGAVRLALPGRKRTSSASRGAFSRCSARLTTGSSPSLVTVPGTSRPLGEPRSRCSGRKGADRGPAEPAC